MSAARRPPADSTPAASTLAVERTARAGGGRGEGADASVKAFAWSHGEHPLIYALGDWDSGHVLVLRMCY